MDLEHTNAVMIPAERIEEKDMTVIVTYQGKRTVINHAAVLKNSTPPENTAYAKITKTKLGTIVEPIGSERADGFFIINDSSENDDVHSFTIEEFVDIYLNNTNVRTAVSNGKYTFYRDNLIPANWQLLSEKDFKSAIKKIQHNPVLRKKKIDDREIYQIDDFANRIKVFTSDRVDDILNEYSFSKKEEDTVGTYLRFLMKKKGIIGARLYEMTGIDKSTLSEYLHDNRNQQKNYLVAISVALRLLPIQSKYLLDLAGICLCRHTQENWLYQLFLDSCAFNKQITVSKCNEFLISKGLALMTNLRVLK